MRERLGVYVALALLGAPLGYFWARPFDLHALDVPQPTPDTLLPIVYEFLRDLVPFLVLSLLARYFIIPSAMRRIDPGYRTTPRRFAIETLVLLVIVAFSVVSYFGSALPGTAGAVASLALLIVAVAAILLSQTLFTALIEEKRPPGDAIGESYRLTKRRFIATLLVTFLGVFIVVLPLNLSILPLFLAMILRSHQWLALGTPLLILLFIYLECVRFALMTRWYEQLAAEPAA
jgi:hypothetical protein